MPIDALRRLFRSVTKKKAEKEDAPKPRPRNILYDLKTKERADLNPEQVDVAADLLAMPMAVRGKTPAQIKEMASSRLQLDKDDRPFLRGMTDTESRRYADEMEDVEKKRNSNIRAVRTDFGGPIRAGDGHLAFGSNDPQPAYGMKKGGKVKSGVSKRGDGIAQRGKTKGRFV